MIVPNIANDTWYLVPWMPEGNTAALTPKFALTRSNVSDTAIASYRYENEDVAVNTGLTNHLTEQLTVLEKFDNDIIVTAAQFFKQIVAWTFLNPAEHELKPYPMRTTIKLNTFTLNCLPKTGTNPRFWAFAIHFEDEDVNTWLNIVQQTRWFSTETDPNIPLTGYLVARWVISREVISQPFTTFWNLQQVGLDGPLAQTRALDVTAVLNMVSEQESWQPETAAAWAALVNPKMLHKYQLENEQELVCLKALEQFNANNATFVEADYLLAIQLVGEKTSIHYDPLTISSIPQQQWRQQCEETWNPRAIGLRVTVGTPGNGAYNNIYHTLARRFQQNALGVLIRDGASAHFDVYVVRNVELVNQFRNVIRLSAGSTLQQYDIATKTWVTTSHPPA